MKKLFIVLIAVLFVFSLPGMSFAKSCISPNKGWSRCPDWDGAGSIGLEGYEFGNGWFKEINATGKVKRIPVQLASVTVDAVGPISFTTAPNLATADNVGKITWDNSSEAAEIQFNYSPSAGMQSWTISAFVNSDTDLWAPTLVGLDWAVYIYDESEAFGTVRAQTAVQMPAGGSGSTQLMTFTPDLTTQGLITAGTSSVKIAIFNSTTHLTAATKMSDLWINETGF